ncbi:Uncharacterised protein [Mycobacterium tuberculosis]|nr:Uncharacterised protein [Mycobacterium tuberculosis]
MQNAVQRDVVDVVTGLLTTRAGLAPAGHPRVDQPVVDLRTFFRTQSQPFGDAGTVTLDQHVGLGDEFERKLESLIGLQVGGHDTPVTQHGVSRNTVDT